MATEQKATKDAGTPEAPAKKKSKLMLIVIMVVALLAAAGGGFFGWKYLKSAKADSSSEEDGGKEKGAKHAEGDEEEEGHGKSQKDKKKKTKEKAHGEEGATINFEPFLVNLADKEASRYVKTSIRLLVGNKEAAETISKGQILMPRLRDTILTILSSRTAEEITNNEGKEKLKKEILAQVNEYLPEESAALEVFFTDFVVQF